MTTANDIIFGMLKTEIEASDKRVEKEREARRNLYGDPVKVDPTLAERLAKEQQLVDPEGLLQVEATKETTNADIARAAFPSPEL